MIARKCQDTVPDELRSRIAGLIGHEAARQPPRLRRARNRHPTAAIPGGGPLRIIGMDETAVAGERVSSADQPSRRFKADRTCAEPELRDPPVDLQRRSLLRPPRAQHRAPHPRAQDRLTPQRGWRRTCRPSTIPSWREGVVRRSAGRARRIDGMALAVIWHYWIGVVLLLVGAACWSCRRSPGTSSRSSGRSTRPAPIGASACRLASSTGSWRERIAVRTGGREPFAESYHYDSLTPDFAELTAVAEELVGESTGLRSLAGPARARVTDRAGWVQANIASFQRLLHPLTDRIGDRLGDRPLAPAHPQGGGRRGRPAARLDVDPGARPVRPAARWRTSPPRTRTSCTTSAPTCSGLEKRFGFPPREFRLWLALHEVTHRAQFTGVPWLREHFIGLVERTLSAIEPDPTRFIHALRRVVERRARGEEPARRRRHRRAAGHAGAGAGAPGDRRDDEPARGARRRHHGPGRCRPHPVGRAVQPGAAPAPPVGATADPRCCSGSSGSRPSSTSTSRASSSSPRSRSDGGPELLNRAFEAPAHLPSLAEIRAPDLWIARIRARPVSAPDSGSGEGDAA